MITGIIFAAFVMVFILGFAARVSSIKVNDNAMMIPFMIFALLPTVMVIVNVSHSIAPIHSAYVHRSMVLCEPEGGLATIDQTTVVCGNGVSFLTDSLNKITPEKE